MKSVEEWTEDVERTKIDMVSWAYKMQGSAWIKWAALAFFIGLIVLTRYILVWIYK